MKKTVFKVASGLALACALFVGFLYAHHDIGLTAASLESDVRNSQKIQDDWTVDGSVSDTMAAYISYPQDMSDHTFSVYVDRPGLSFGIAEYTVDWYPERAFISMNQQQAARLEIDDGNATQVVDLDSSKPFAMVLPINAGTVTFYDVNGNPVEYWKHPL